MKYRKSKLEDCDDIYALICDLENKELCHEKFCKIYQDQINDPHYYCLICEQDGVIVGSLNMHFEMQLHHTEQIAEIFEFVIASTHRNMGIGKTMLARGCKIADENGCSQIEVASNQLRKDTHRFYIREGMHNNHFKFSKGLDGRNAL